MDKDTVQKSAAVKQIAISLPNITAGRQINEGDIIYSDLSEDEFRKLKKLSKFLTSQDVDVLKEIAEMKRKENPVWGI